MSPAVHELKMWPEYFDAVVAGTKRCDIRRCDDRVFRVLDEIVFVRTPRPTAGGAAADTTNREECRVVVTHIERKAGALYLFGIRFTEGNDPGLLAEIAVLSFRRLSW